MKKLLRTIGMWLAFESVDVLRFSRSCCENRNVSNSKGQTKMTTLKATRFLTPAFLCVALLCLIAVPLLAQTASTGTVAGTVTDASGAVIPGAMVTLTDLSTKEKRSTTSNEAGRY